MHTGAWRRVIFLVLSIGFLTGCSKSSQLKALGDETGAASSAKPAPRSSAATTSRTLSDAGATPGGDAGAPSTAASVAGNCGDLVCRGHGKCTEVSGTASCMCDTGYIARGTGADYECVVDKSCKRLHMLQESGCVQLVNSVPAVALFFAVDYCSGTAVLPEELGDLSKAFRILENGKDLSDESVATVVPRDVESYVTLAIDVSKSVSGSADDPLRRKRLAALVGELRNFVAALKAPSGAPPVSVSVLVFGRFVSEYVPYTSDLAEVDAALQMLETAPEAVVSTVSAQGTALFDATTKGIQSVERIQRLRSLVTAGGVLTTGTLVVVTDGADTVGATLDSSRLDKTLVNLVSVGISNDIDDKNLGAIGRNGSFLAPAQEDWAKAFTEIAQRVQEYPKRAYLLAYCTSLSNGDPEVSVSLQGEKPQSLASCKFDADLFSRDPQVASACDLDFFKHYCDSAECGTFLACGACDDAGCCSAGRCAAPQMNVDCQADDALCAPAELSCVKQQDNSYTCDSLPGPSEVCSAAST